MEKDLEKIRELNLEKKVYRLRHRDGISWNDVVIKINEEFNKSFSSKKIEEIYDRYISRSNSIRMSKDNSRRASEKVNKEWVDEMKRLLDTIKTKAMKHLEIADELLITEYESGNTKAYFKNLPVAISLFRSLLDQAGFLGNRLEKIEVNQNNFILTETQILQLVNKRMSQREKDQGYKISPATGKIIMAKAD